jgi:mannose-6-phosphate isomerase-like protein (cupin superfamily)
LASSNRDEVAGRGSFRVVHPDDLLWETRPHGPDEPARHVAEFSGLANFERSRGNVWRYEPGSVGKRHIHGDQEETFVVLHGTLTMYLGEPPERHDVQAGGLIHARPGTPLQSANHGDVDLVVYAYGTPPDEGADVLESAV